MPIQSLKKIYAGKVRDLYEIDAQRMLMVATDRLSAFDVILEDPIPKKGEILTQLSLFWFDKLSAIMPNHLTGERVEDVLNAAEAAEVAKCALVVKKLKALPLEAIVRGFLAGSAWKEYQQSATVAGCLLPTGLCEAQMLPDPLFCPTTKAVVGGHDQAITIEQLSAQIGAELARSVRDKALELYQFARQYAHTCGILIADTKFEFGLDEKGGLTLMDEVLTPDSSRFWPQEHYCPGHTPESFDKQGVRDWLEASGWNKQAPAPKLPAALCQKTAERYQEALLRLTQGSVQTSLG